MPSRLSMLGTSISVALALKIRHYTSLCENQDTQITERILECVMTGLLTSTKSPVCEGSFRLEILPAVLSSFLLHSAIQFFTTYFRTPPFLTSIIDCGLY